MSVTRRDASGEPDQIVRFHFRMTAGSERFLQQEFAGYLPALCRLIRSAVSMIISGLGYVLR